ncbi:MAG TPA: AraC family transcriptional regulator [Gammaproteobacteria bacterium]|nr:AraC family transcriptional regulator [Gammaproteobacteria bacterium]
MSPYTEISPGRERWSAHQRIPRHVHDRAYFALVLAGGYEECGSRGRFHAGPGDVLLHSAFDAHLDRFAARGAEILNLPTDGPVPGYGLGRVPDPDAVARLAESDTAAACACLQEQLRAASWPPEDWPDALARDLLADPAYGLGRWAREHGLAPATVSRGFDKIFGMSPARFRAEARARRAYALIVWSEAPLASIATAVGFADQAHMCRATRMLTGASPQAWRRSNPFKTVAGAGG